MLPVTAWHFAKSAKKPRVNDAKLKYCQFEKLNQKIYKQISTQSIEKQSQGDKLQKLIDCLWSDEDHPTRPQVYAIFDGARDPCIASMVQECNLEYSCLYAGSLTPSLQKAAPYLVHLANNSFHTRNLLQMCWGRSWSIFLVVSEDVTLQALRRHCRTLLRVKDEAGRILIFRFYDPRVIRIYLPTCVDHEITEFFGPIRNILAEAENADHINQYEVKNKTLVAKKIFL